MQGSLGITAGQQAESGWGTGGSGGIMLGKTDAPFPDTIHVRSGNVAVVSTYVIHPLVICENHKYIGSSLCESLPVLASGKECGGA
ncbi:MAG: hypothetical protein A2268_12450 [Candidatus Raymondbacteria bacterium RifOxyA12_full_50_37]|uniref:Uncharacterized protein n=1 Tax=Candidatus Raymondbacteria bacterium RIFOXYD12_FULL_49_13 TaxID=1817890 RepID=A0A1F7FIJ8_UNCRA|nr:MAG: hypothetical protein A2268_12450 [Candidatus Raymondbacteria bacterium RifOxyA12_full_50_37]OGJ91348.1 MAG: hypothetical protein A2248_03945 [Candidatus Raymondbacteria bacterium RIFOXYA2_FULL_49_16]OGJ97747.1 MAG: hypothetical protein A2453_13775 [Candidatus Raymondbacteria bacterium RIFOXYC2_FULL_50_21]OGK00151.1 MAG: hypothetical protein A2487_09555 [Candidatus Raymondbacteria bacterium RifOxyC12_full_50_8]OGK06391.1 MAG: hypothetical protein A2519_11890 [Candidatus Raymondbacteria b